MSYKKIKVVSPESVRNPENGHIYLGYGYSSTYDDTAPWIKKEDGSFYLISGGTGGGGESGIYVPYINAIKHVNLGHNNFTVDGDTYVKYLGVGGNLNMITNNSKIQAAVRTDGGAASINLPAASNPNSLSDGDIWTTTTSIYARINGVTKDLAATGGDSFWSAWSTYGIQYINGSTWMKNSYIGGTAISVNTTDDILTVKGAITLSDTNKTNVGTIRYNTTTSDFEGYIGNKWYSLTAGAHEAGANEFIYNDSGGALVGTSKLMYSTNGIGVNISDPKSSFEISGSFGSKTTIVTSNTILDETHHTIICSGTSLIQITLPRIQPVGGTSCDNREYTICKYGTGNIQILTSILESLTTEYIEFYGSSNSGQDGFIDFNDDVPQYADSKFILYQVTIRAVLNYPDSGKATWLVTNFSSAYGEIS